ncbi:MAG: hypothetical protein BGO07_01830 [Alphaproteobacteria bacterium 40-19]|nr:MAG: hypothetical protein BGO07_01830 [Alphaproteobacteria bacterium 40-19]
MKFKLYSFFALSVIILPSPCIGATKKHALENKLTEKIQEQEYRLKRLELEWKREVQDHGAAARRNCRKCFNLSEQLAAVKIALKKLSKIKPSKYDEKEMIEKKV